MKASVLWTEGMAFDGVAEENGVKMDAKPPIGKGSGATPKELVAIGLGGCTSMDVIALLKKYKQTVKSFKVDIDIQTSTGTHPVVFEKAMLNFIAEGEINPEQLKEAVNLSQTKYCGVSAMLSRSFPIEYRIVLNGAEIGKGFAKFESK